MKVPVVRPGQRQALVLRYYAGLPQAQIATAMGISTGAVKGHISRAMTTLRGPEDMFGLATRPEPFAAKCQPQHESDRLNTQRAATIQA